MSEWLPGPREIQCRCRAGGGSFANGIRGIVEDVAAVAGVVEKGACVEQRVTDPGVDRPYKLRVFLDQGTDDVYSQRIDIGPGMGVAYHPLESGEIGGSEPSWCDPDHEMVEIIQQNVEALGRPRPTPIVSLGGTDARLWRHRGIPAYVYGRGPDYAVFGGLVFQELTVPYLSTFGDWQRRGPPRLLIAHDRFHIRSEHTF